MMTDTSADNLTNLEPILEHAAKVHKNAPNDAYKQKFQEEFIPPVMGMAKQMSPEEQANLLFKATHLVKSPGEKQASTRFVPDPGTQSIGATRITQKHFPHKNEPAPEGHFQYTNINKAMREGGDTHDEAAIIAANLERYMTPIATRRQEELYPNGSLVSNYDSEDDNPETRQFSNILNLYNDYEPIKQEQYRDIFGPGEEFGFAPHPKKYKISGQFDSLTRGREGTNHANQFTLWDLKTDYIPNTELLAPILDKAPKHASQMSLYKWLFTKKGIPATNYGVFYTKPGIAVIYSNQMLDNIFNKNLKNFISDMHKSQNKYQNLWDLIEGAPKAKRL